MSPGCLIRSCAAATPTSCSRPPPRQTSSIGLGVLLTNPVTRHPSVTASSIATIDELAPGRVELGWGAGDTAVRLIGLRPAKVAEMESGIVLMRRLLDGEQVEVGAERPAQLPFHRPVPIWLTAGGPRTLEMGGRVADGVFIRVGTHPALIEDSVARIRRGACERRPRSGGRAARHHLPHRPRR